MNFFIMKISTIFVCFIFLPLMKTARMETIKNETKPESKPEWEGLIAEELMIINSHNNSFLMIIFNLTNIFNMTVNPITENAAVLIKEIIKLDEDLRDKLLKDIAKKIPNVEESTFVIEDDYVPLKDTDSLTGAQIFGLTLIHIESFLYSLGVEKPKIEFLAVNLKTLESTFKANGIETEFQTEGNKKGEPTLDDMIVGLYVKKSKLMYSLMKCLIQLRYYSEHVYHKILLLSLLHKDFQKIVKDDEKLTPALVAKFNWHKRYEFVEMSIQKMKKLIFSDIFPETYQTDALMIVTGSSPSANATFRKFKFGNMVKDFGKNVLSAARSKLTESLGFEPSLPHFKQPFTKGVSQVQAIAEQVKKGKITMANIKQYVKGKYDDFDVAVPNLIKYFSKEPEPSVEHQAYCMKKKSHFKTITRMPTLERFMERARC